MKNYIVLLFFGMLFISFQIEAQSKITGSKQANVKTEDLLPEGTKVFKNIEYVRNGHPLQKLDLYLPKNPENKPLPLVIWIHGGGWKKGSKDKIERNLFLLDYGFALVSVDYRLTSDAIYPAQIYDCKAAIRYLRKNARGFALDPENFGVWGSSAGGHLVALLGTTNGNKTLEGDLGVTNVSSDIQAVCDWFGPSDLVKMSEWAAAKGGPDFDPSQRNGVKLIGGLIPDNLEKAKQASPINFVSEDDVPFLIMHGDADELVPVSESENLYKALQAKNVESELIVVPGAGHGFFKDKELYKKVIEFFLEKLKVDEFPALSENKNEKHLNAFIGNWAMTMPEGQAAWLTIKENQGKINGEIWMVGAPKPLTNVTLKNNKLYFIHHRAIGEPEYVGGPPTGKKIPLNHVAELDGDVINVVFDKPLNDGNIEKVKFSGKRIAPLPEKPDLSKIEYGEPIRLFNGKNLDGWRLTNERQTNRWKVVEGVLFNDTPKKSFDPFARYGNLRTNEEFTDFNLQLDFNVPEEGNSGIYLRGRYEVQVVDKYSRMQGLHGVGAVFNRIMPNGNFGKAGGEWQHFDITLVGRYITVILNGVKVIDNAPIEGCTNGALSADESLPGPIYLQGDHTPVRYRNIILRPIIKK